MNYSVIPEPKKIICSDKEVFTLTRLCEIEAESCFEKSVKSLKKFLSDSFSLELLGTGRESVTLCLDENIREEEGYILTVTQDRVTVKGKTEVGVFYGVQTLKQMLMQGNLTLTETEVYDSPAFSYRGFMLDCGRYFFTKEAVFLFLEIMALHKLNNFHWHLTDDQGWRAQAESQLLLTEIGSYRSHTNFNKTAHSGYYTKADMKEIVDYAHSLYIKVIPEIDSPGHTVSAIASYPHLSCFDRELTVDTKWGIKYDVFCVGKESTFDFMYSVFDELCETFTDGIFHLGGDEVPTLRWEMCPHCQKRIKDENLQSTDDLHTYYLNRLGSYLKDKGIDVVMWNDKKKDYMVSSDITWQMWNGDMKAEEIAEEINKGRPFINSASDYYYLDLPYGQVPLEKTYNYDPVFEGIDKDKLHLLKGVEACLWTEFVPTMRKAGYCTFPRLGAFSETAWTKKENKDYDRFLKKLDSYYAHLDAMGLDFAAVRQAQPNPARKILSRIYWERRRLCWGGLHNLIDNASVKRSISKNKGED